LREKQELKYRNPKFETNLNDQKAQIPNKLVSDFGFKKVLHRRWNMNAPLKVTGIDHVVFHVKDLEREEVLCRFSRHGSGP